LNDTDAEVERTLEGNLLEFGFPNRKEGTDIFSGEKFVVEDGKLTLKLPPRESRFIRFEANPVQ
jgi:hypothetical protein